MNSSEQIIKKSIKKQPIGETDSFIWFICDIGIVAVFKDNRVSEKKSCKEALSIALDLSKEEKENYLIDGKKVFLFYS
tara:strand:+ start:274 stop:507 length:234 start_codon:yes stop_codon:yes gene_type:complete